MLQCLAFALLGMQTITAGHAGGISARALSLDVLALICRLSSTLWLNGYLPVDASGDWVYQAIDLCSLALVFGLLYQVLVRQRHTYQKTEDSFPIAPIACACFLLATLLHADMNDRPLFDTLWMTGLFISVVAVLPQLWLISKSGGKVESLTSHYIATMALSRILSGTFMWHARFDITCAFWIDGFDHAVWAILAAHLLHIILLADFGYYYIRGVAKDGLACQLELGDVLV